MGNGSSILGACNTPIGEEFKLQPKELLTEAELSDFIRETLNDSQAQHETVEERYHRYLNALTPKVEEIKACTDAFVDEIQIGLNCHKKFGNEPFDQYCSLKCIDSCIPRLPTGQESGVTYALDFGGSNFRIVRCQLENGRISTVSKKACLSDAEVPYPKGIMDPKASATQMFDFFAKVCEDFMSEYDDLNSPNTYSLGFTFSFPCIQRKLNSAVLVNWTKGFATGRDSEDPVVDCDVAELMNIALRKRGVPLRVNCVANDTCGTLLACAYENARLSKPACAVGVILGTGHNSCYYEEKAADYGYRGKIINLESGNFNRCLPRANVDFELDFADTAGRGRQHTEKMVSGAYLGEITRRTLVKIFQHLATPLMWQPYSLTAEDVATCVGDKSDSLVVVERKMKERFNFECTLPEREWIKNICAVVYKRAAAIATVVIAGSALKTGKLQEALGGCTVGIDGSVFKCNKFFVDDIVIWLRLVLGERKAALIHIENADDGSGTGAAVLSAIAAAS